jgi:histidinol-phosphatase (PHP family)
MAYEMGIDITFGSDAHSVEQVGFAYEDAINVAKKIGFKNCVTFEKRDRKTIQF